MLCLLFISNDWIESKLVTVMTPKLCSFCLTLQLEFLIKMALLWQRELSDNMVEYGWEQISWQNSTLFKLCTTVV